MSLENPPKDFRPPKKVSEGTVGQCPHHGITRRCLSVGGALEDFKSQRLGEYTVAALRRTSRTCSLKCGPISALIALSCVIAGNARSIKISTTLCHKRSSLPIETIRPYTLTRGLNAKA